MNRRELFRGALGGILSAILPSKELGSVEPIATNGALTVTGPFPWGDFSWEYYQDGIWKLLGCEFKIGERRPGT